MVSMRKASAVSGDLAGPAAAAKGDAAVPEQTGDRVEPLGVTGRENQKGRAAVGFHTRQSIQDLRLLAIHSGTDDHDRPIARDPQDLVLPFERTLVGLEVVLDVAAHLDALGRHIETGKVFGIGIGASEHLRQRCEQRPQGPRHPPVGGE